MHTYNKLTTPADINDIATYQRKMFSRPIQASPLPYHQSVSVLSRVQMPTERPTVAPSAPKTRELPTVPVCTLPSRARKKNEPRLSISSKRVSEYRMCPMADF